jgi:hypothetical protein
MAVKKSKPAAASTKAPAKKGAARPKTEAASKNVKSTPAVATETATKAETPRPRAAPKAPAPAAPKKAAAPVKLTDRQLDFLKQVQGAKETGYLGDKKAEQKTLEALLNRKLIKKAAKDKASGNFRYIVSKAGEKHLSTISPA